MSPLLDSTYALCFLALIIPVASNGLIITPPEEEIVYPAGYTFELRCEYDSPVSWSYESRSENEDATDNVAYDSNENWAKLTITNASFLNVKSYTCTADADPTVEKSIYVFVRDVDHLLVSEEEFDIISFYTSEDMVVPCKPSFPEVHVTLRTLADSEMLAYDNKKGFTVRLHKPKHLECVGTFKTSSVTHSTSVLYEVEQMHRPPDAPPTPDIELVGKGPNDHIVVGQNVTLRCSVSSPPGVHYRLIWKKPTNNDVDRFIIEDTSVRTKYLPHNNTPYNLATSPLTILRVKASDAGAYTCFVEDSAMQESSLVYNFKVYNDTKFLNITFNGNSTIISRLGKPEVVLMANIAAHPSPGITWSGPNGQTIESSKKYNITLDMESTRLIVYRPNTADSGVYALKAQSEAGVKALRYTLRVEGAPIVKIEEYRGAYLLKTKRNVTCNVMGYPEPQVEMAFRPCTSSEPKSCSSTSKLIQTHKRCNTSCNYTAVLNIVSQGILSCSATNSFDSVSSATYINVTDVPNEFHVYNQSVGNGNISDLDYITLVCGASKTSFRNDLTWQFIKRGTTVPVVLAEDVLDDKDGIQISKNDSEITYWSTMSIMKPKVNQSGKYICSGKTRNEFRIVSRATTITVSTSVVPSFEGAANNSDSDLSPGSLLIWYCNASGIPEPSLVWYKNGEMLKSDRAKTIKNILSIDHVDRQDEGSYKCVATNKKGFAALVFHLKIKRRDPMRAFFEWLGIIVSSIIVIICIIVVIYQRRKMKKHKKEREANFPAELYFFQEGQVEYINPNLDIGEQADFLPYNQAWEFPLEKLKLGKQLGIGAFGVVMKAEATGLRNDEEKTIVAVKMVKKNSDLTLIKALASELKIMAHLGQHVNVVNLLGACTRNIAHRELLVMVEFCKYGNLHDFLLTHRDRFINQVNPGSGNLEIIPSENSMGFPVGVSKSNSNYRGGSDYNTAGSNCATVTTDMTLLSTPVGDDGYLLNKELSQHYQGDFKQNEKRTICTQDLLCWGFQIAKGMEYLASRKVLHGDLATRNTLLAENNVVKICDFGLAKSMYKTDIYTKAGNELLPIKWMPIEALEDRVFSTQSDVWAYGIVLWELFTLSRTPYPGVQPSDVLTLLKSGYRMEKPEYATEDVYNVMIECWNKSPMLRPSFTECAERLGSMLEESVKQHYMDLNNPYAEFNSHLPNGRDYLSILSPPTYVNCTTAAHDEGNVGNDYVPMQHDHRYKSDREKDAVELRPMLPQPDS